MTTAFQLYHHPKSLAASTSLLALPGAKLNFYLTTTTTPTDTYTTSALNVAHTNPVVADVAGVFPAIYLSPDILYKVTYTTAADVLIYTIDPVNDQVLSASAIGQLLYPLSAAEQSAGLTDADIVDETKEYGNVLRYGENTTPGTTNMSGAFNAASAVLLAQGGGTLLAPPGIYLFTSQWTHSQPFCLLSGYGATLKTSGAIWAGVLAASRCKVEGFYVDQKSNGTALGGFDAHAAPYTLFERVTVESSGEAAGYIGFRARATTEGVEIGGSYWVTYFKCELRGAANTMPIGIQLLGLANDATVLNCQFGGVLSQVQLQGTTGGPIGHYTPNNCRIEDCALEVGTYGVDVIAAANDPCTGLKVFGNRSENMTYLARFTGSAIEPGVPAKFGNNFLTGSGHILNASGIGIDSDDSSITPSINPARYMPAFSARCISGNWAVMFASGQGYEIQDAAGAFVGSIINRVGSGMTLGATNGMDLLTLDGISTTGTRAKNVKGSTSFAAATTVNVTFAVNEADASYNIWTAHRQNPGGFIFTSSRATTGFTINCSAVTSAATDWLLIR